MKLNLSEIKKLRITYRDLTRELGVLDTKQARAAEAMKRATANGDIESPAIQRTLGDSRLVIDACTGRRGHVLSQIDGTREALFALCKTTARTWNKELATRRDAKEREIVKVLLPFFDGNVRGAENLCGNFYDKFPCFYDLSRAGVGVPNKPERDPNFAFGLADNISRHIRSYAGKLGIKLDADDANETE